MSQLSTKQIKHLRGLAHSLKPIVIIGDKGLTQAVLDEIDHALAAHELLKVKIRADEREQREAMVETICKKNRCEFVQRVGHVVTFFKRNKEAKIALPKD